MKIDIKLDHNPHDAQGWTNRLVAEKIGKEAASFITAPFRGIKNTLSAIIKTPFFTALNAIKSGYAKLKYYIENPLLEVRDGME